MDLLSSTLPWGDGHYAIVDALTWLDNSRLKCVSRAFHQATEQSNRVNTRGWWGQAQSTEQDVEGLLPSLVRQRKVLTPQQRPNLAMLMIDRSVLLTSTLRNLCGRLHSAHLVPLECPIVVAESDAGVFGAGTCGEGSFSKYENRDIELDPAAPVTAVLTVGFIPPEGRKGSHGDKAEPRVRCFVVNDAPENRRIRFGRGVPDASMACATWRGSYTPAAGAGHVSVSGAAISSGTTGVLSASGKKRPANAPAGLDSGSPDHRLGERADTRHEPRSKGRQQPVRRSTRASTVASSRALSQRSVRPELTPLSSRTPLEGADTIILIGDHPVLLSRTSLWLQRLLGEEAVVLGGVSRCALVVGDQVFRGANGAWASHPSASLPLAVGVALRGVHANVVSARGFEGVGSTFRVDTLFDATGAPQDQDGGVLHHVTVVSEGGADLRTCDAMSILMNDVPEDPAWGEQAFDAHDMFVGLSDSPAELMNFRHASWGQSQGTESEDARGIPPMCVTSAYEERVAVLGNVRKGQYARFLRTTAQLCLTEIETVYRSCIRRIEREGGVALSSINFACCVRPDLVEQLDDEGGDGDEMGVRVMALHQQEMVRFIKTMKVPAAGVFCRGELGPYPHLLGGICPKPARSYMQYNTSCAAVLSWNPSLAKGIPSER